MQAHIDAFACLLLWDFFLLYINQMKTAFLLALLAACLSYYYSQDSVAPRPARENAAAVESAPKAVDTSAIVIAALPSYSERWKTGPNAQTENRPQRTGRLRAFCPERDGELEPVFRLHHCLRGQPAPLTRPSAEISAAASVRARGIHLGRARRAT